jgi:hypothetical protein
MKRIISKYIGLLAILAGFLLGVCGILFIAIADVLISIVPVSVPTQAPFVQSTEQLLGQDNFLEGSENLLTPTQEVVVVAYTPTPAPIPVDNFWIPSSNPIAPDDIFEEVGYYPVGGGEVSFFSAEPDYSECDSPMIWSDPWDTELMASSVLTVCGLSSNEVVIGKVSYPDGREVTKNIIPSHSGNGMYHVELEFTPSIVDPVGIYNFYLEASDSVFESNAYFRKPAGPRLTILGHNTLTLHGFYPYEQVRLFLYESSTGKWRLEGWETYRVNADGNLSIFVHFEENDERFFYRDEGISKFDLPLTFVSVGEKTGEIILSGWIDYISEYRKVGPSFDFGNYFDCTSEQLARSRIFELLSFRTLGPVNVHANPRVSARVVRTPQDNTIIEKRFRPYCRDSQIWWAVPIDMDRYGYVMETDGQDYYLSP